MDMDAQEDGNQNEVSNQKVEMCLLGLGFQHLKREFGYAFKTVFVGPLDSNILMENMDMLSGFGPKHRKMK